jgi:phosphatidylinositol phospholipase C delta
VTDITPVPIENIKELRSGPDARYYREQFQLAAEYEDRWLSIIYIIDGQYKTLHLIASTKDVFHMWDTTLRKLHRIRKELMSGLGNIEMRQAIWEKQYWRAGDEERDQKLAFEEVERLCKRLNVSSSTEELERLFKVFILPVSYPSLVTMQRIDHIRLFLL